MFLKLQVKKKTLYASRKVFAIPVVHHEIGTVDFQLLEIATFYIYLVSSVPVCALPREGERGKLNKKKKEEKNRNSDLITHLSVTCRYANHMSVWLCFLLLQL